MLYIVTKFSIMKKNQIILLALLLVNSFLFAQDIPTQLNEAIRLQEQYKESVALQKFDLIEANAVNIGDPIVIKIGGTPTTVAAVFTGIITGIATEISLNSSFIIIHCSDKAVGMTKGRNTQIFLKKKDDAILFAKLPVLATLQADRKFTGALACN